MKKPLFSLGQVVATPGALDLLERNETDPVTLISRHIVGDWGTLCEEDSASNAAALKYGSRVMSVYPVGLGIVWIITEADRSSTTLLLPDEY